MIDTKSDFQINKILTGHSDQT